MTDTLVRTYSPRGTALELFRRREPEVILSGPAGTGKSRACLEKLHAMMLANPGARALIVRKTLTSLGSTALVTYREHVAREAIAVGDVSFYGGSAQESAQYRYSNGACIVVGGMDKATRVMSAEYDVIYVQEAIELTEGDWEALLSRLRNGVISFQQIIADTNPSTPTHWVKARSDSGKLLMLNSRHEENPRLFDVDGVITEGGQAYMNVLDSLTGVRKSRLRDGLWVAAEGIIYEAFDPAIHIVERKLPSASWPRYWSIDFGFTNPFVLQCWAEDPDGRLVLYREIYRSRVMVEDHAADIMNIVAPVDPKTKERVWREPRPSWVVCDHDAEGRATFTRATGLNTVAATKAVQSGIEAVAKRLAPAADGRPRLLFQRDIVVRRDQALADAKKPMSTLEEIPGYVWDAGSRTETTKEVPLKENDHGADAMRYIVVQRDLGVRPRIRVM